MGGVVSYWKSNANNTSDESTTDVKVEPDDRDDESIEEDENTGESSSDEKQCVDDDEDDEDEDGDEENEIDAEDNEAMNSEAEAQQEGPEVKEYEVEIDNNGDLVDSSENLEIVGEMYQVSSSDAHKEFDVINDPTYIQPNLVVHSSITEDNRHLGDVQKHENIEVVTLSTDTNGNSQSVQTNQSQNGRGTKPKKYECDYPDCGLKYTTRTNLNRHIAKCHRNPVSETRKRDISPDSDRSTPNLPSLINVRVNDSPYTNRNKRPRSSETDSVSSRSDRASVISTGDELDHVRSKSSKDQVIPIFA